ncbi:hypothetical protein Tco_1137408, partial [Tanacetum coccineum]
MDDPNITMEEYIRLEEEKARRRVLNDSLTSNETPSCEPTVSTLNDNWKQISKKRKKSKPKRQNRARER